MHRLLMPPSALSNGVLAFTLFAPQLVGALGPMEMAGSSNAFTDVLATRASSLARENPLLYSIARCVVALSSAIVSHPFQCLSSPCIVPISSGVEEIKCTCGVGGHGRPRRGPSIRRGRSGSS